MMKQENKQKIQQKRQQKRQQNKTEKVYDHGFILRFETGILIISTIICITIAWFVLNNQAKVKQLKLAASTDEYIRVALEEGGEDVLELVEPDNIMSVNMPEFLDLEEEKMAPGVYGHFDLYITAISPIAKKCDISLKLICEYIDSVDISAKQAIIDNLLKGHLQFYTRLEDGDYSGLISEKYRMDLSYNIEKKLTVYWVWFYEYTDIPAAGLGLNPENYFDMDKYDEDLASGYTDEDKVNLYDYGDTLIGLEVKNIGLEINIDGIVLDGE